MLAGMLGRFVGQNVLGLWVGQNVRAMCWPECAVFCLNVGVVC